MSRSNQPTCRVRGCWIWADFEISTLVTFEASCFFLKRFQPKARDGWITMLVQTLGTFHSAGRPGRNWRTHIRHFALYSDVKSFIGKIPSPWLIRWSDWLVVKDWLNSDRCLVQVVDLGFAVMAPAAWRKSPLVLTACAASMCLFLGAPQELPST